MAKTVAGVYPTLQDTIDAIDSLTAKGYNPSNISVITNGNDTDYLENRTGTTVNDASALTNTENENLWDKIKEFFTPGYYDQNTKRLTNLDIPQGELDRYSQEINAGNYLVLLDDSHVDGSGNTGDDAGITGADPQTAGNASSDPQTIGEAGANPVNEFDETYSTNQEKKLDVREEELHVNKKPVKTGEVKVNKEVKTEERNFDVPVQHEEVYVERRPVDENSASEPVDGSETIKVPIVEEQVEVTKKPVKKEEIVIGKHTVNDKEHVSETVKKEEAHVNQGGTGNVDNSSKS
ncbi:YsnF/AvaK domain-containing protein [Heyndrickxia acidiproducens]|uniref:YsnF/AvaK domain-containing protein n=1 Tax=Heyndrickxia acidiproducens TaxID=1121084 RepID=UPI0003601E28|nr:YsnF/AvaK domain-containing protein [Heyndrickxia acidiproducens]